MRIHAHTPTSTTGRAQALLAALAAAGRRLAPEDLRALQRLVAASRGAPALNPSLPTARPLPWTPPGQGGGRDARGEAGERARGLRTAWGEDDGRDQASDAQAAPAPRRGRRRERDQADPVEAAPRHGGRGREEPDQARDLEADRTPGEGHRRAAPHALDGAGPAGRAPPARAARSHRQEEPDGPDETPAQVPATRGGRAAEGAGKAAPPARRRKGAAGAEPDQAAGGALGALRRMAAAAEAPGVAEVQAVVAGLAAAGAPLGAGDRAALAALVAGAAAARGLALPGAGQARRLFLPSWNPIYDIMLGRLVHGIVHGMPRSAFAPAAARPDGAACGGAAAAA